MSSQSENKITDSNQQKYPVSENAETDAEEEIETEMSDIDPASLLETTSQAEDTSETDKLIGKGLKLPPVQSDGLW